MTKISAASLVAAATGTMKMPTGEVGDLAISVDQIKTYTLSGLVTGGDVVGPAGAVDSNFAAFDTVTGKLIKDSGYNGGSFDASGSAASALALANLYTDAQVTTINTALGTKWSLVDGGTLTGTNTITSNARNQLNFNGTWTSTVTGDYHTNWGGAITALSGGANTLNYMTLTPTITANNNGQILNTFVINPTYSVGAFTGTSRVHLQLGDATVGTTFQQSPDNASRGLNIESKSTWASYAFRFNSASQNTSSGNLNAMILNGTFGNISSGTGAYAQLQLNYSLNQSGGTGVIRGLYYNPSITAVINHTAIQTTAGRLAFNMTGNPTAQAQFRGAGTTTGSNLLVEDSAQVQRFLIQDNGDVTFGTTANGTTMRNSAAPGNTKGFEFASLSGHLTYAFRFNIAGVSGSEANGNFIGLRTGSTVFANGATTGTYKEFTIITDFDNTSASATQSCTMISVDTDTNINATAGTSTFTLLDYNPTIASSTGLTHYGIRIRPAVYSAFGTSTAPVALVQIGAGTTAYAPLKLTTGTNLTSAQAGAFEYDNTLYFTQSDATRRNVVLAASATKTTGGAPYANDGYITMRIGGTDVRIMTTA